MKRGLDNWDPKIYEEADVAKPPMNHEDYTNETIKEFTEFMDFFNPMRIMGKVKENLFLAKALTLIFLICCLFWLTRTSWDDLEGPSSYDSY